MVYNKYLTLLLVRILLLLLSLAGLAWGILFVQYQIIVPTAILSIFITYNLSRYILRRFAAMDDFFEAVRYRDFSRWFDEKSGPEDMRALNKGFNEVNRTIKEINAERETQYLYLQKILAMVDVGIIAYYIESGKVLWVNEAFKNLLDIPSLKNIRFIAIRKPDLYEKIFETFHTTPHSLPIEVNKEQLTILVSDTVFHAGNDAFKLVLLQNIDAPLNEHEAQAWKKLLSVMTHEIMNSIAPISSLANTLQRQVQQHLDNSQKHLLNIEDINAGISSIQSRSEGLLKFAKTYRSLNKVVHLNRSKVSVTQLFGNIHQLLQPSLETRGIRLEFLIEPVDLEIDLDAHLIEQVLINLILNAAEASNQGKQEASVIKITATRGIDRKAIIRVRDQGIGIPVEIQDQIFVPFFSTKKSGSGIGLSLCKQIMLLHKGKIQVNSRQGKDTVISLIFNDTLS